jgi:alpha/beta superfamily hydrolase
MKTLSSFGFPVLRFNFRGAGLSDGGHDRGHGEQEDVRLRSTGSIPRFTCP